MEANWDEIMKEERRRLVNFQAFACSEPSLLTPRMMFDSASNVLKTGLMVELVRPPALGSIGSIPLFGPDQYIGQFPFQPTSLVWFQ